MYTPTLVQPFCWWTGEHSQVFLDILSILFPSTYTDIRELLSGGSWKATPNL